MGVPKFFRWLSERYPLASTLVAEGNVPDFDNLYLDMNGIIHSASHPQTDADSGPSVARPEHLVFREIFAYVELLFTKIRPKKVFFLAVDGVAPRAKLNQQRARRFRTAYEAGREAFDDKSPTPKDNEDIAEYFDSNCITPGTQFMYRLQQHLEYFISVKMKDPQWRHVRVILSGPATPGEGEHKIMEFIRHCRAQPDYDPNTKHCLYGLDADLIMLGLLSHAPHFCLLREEVKFGQSGRKGKSRHERVKEAKAANRLSSQRFYLMHLGIIRDYFEEEFVRIPNADLKTPRTVERVIDDIILMAMLVGNDFLPNLPHMHVNEGALGLLFDAYKSFADKNKNPIYLNERGLVQYDKLAILLDKLRDFELSRMETEMDDEVEEIDYLRHPSLLPKDTITESMADVVDTFRRALLDDQLDTFTLRFFEEGSRDFAMSLCCEMELMYSIFEYKDDYMITVENDDIFELEDVNGNAKIKNVIKRYKKFKVIEDVSSGTNDVQFDEWKAAYYKKKMPGVDPQKVARDYALGLQWVVHYYYEGVQSWSWFYPHHYAPHLSDLATAMRSMPVGPRFEMGQPLRPLEQLMAVLPPASGALLPAPLYTLMQSPKLSSFYPLKFEQDMNGKKQSWEAVVLIPFIDEKVLIPAIKSVMSSLGQHDLRVNEFGEARIFEYVAGWVSRCVSPSPDHFPTIPDCPCRVSDYKLPPIPAGAISGFWTGAVRGVDRSLPGFPSLFEPIAEHSAALENVGVQLFNGQSSAKPSLLLKMIGTKMNEKLKNGATVLCDWPMCKLAVVVDAKADRVSERIRETLLTQRAIRIPDDDYGVVVRLLEGDDSEKSTTSATIVYPRSLIISDPIIVDAFAEKVRLKSGRSVESLYPLGSTVIILAQGQLYGRAGTVMKCSEQDATILVDNNDPKLLQSLRNPAFDKPNSQDPFMPLHVLAKQANLPTLLVSKLCSSFVVFDDLDTNGKGDLPKHDLGLRVKYEGRGLVQLDACSRGQGGLEYSHSVLKLLLAYRQQFPQLFARLAETVKAERLTMSILFPGQTKQASRNFVTLVKKWLSMQGVGSQPLVGEGSVVANKNLCNMASQLIDNIKKSTKPDGKSEQIVKLPIKALLSVATAAAVSVNITRTISIGNRVRYIGPLYPFGALGTVVGVIYQGGRPADLEILLDDALPGLACNLGGRCHDYRGIVVAVEEVMFVDSPDMAVSIDVHPGTTNNPGERKQRVSVSTLFKAASSSTKIETPTDDLVALFKQKASLQEKKPEGSQPSMSGLLRKASKPSGNGRKGSESK